MMEWIDHRSKRYAIIGMKGKIESVPELVKKVDSLSKELGVGIQLMNASMVYCKEHLEVATENAITAWDLKWNMANTLPVEVLMFASTRRQISEAIALMGLKEGEWDIAAVILAELNKFDLPEDIAPLLGFERDDTVLEGGSDVILDELGVDSVLRMMFPRDQWKDLLVERITMFGIER
jgi:KEOPS complex subunit Cgi121